MKTNIRWFASDDHHGFEIFDDPEEAKVWAEDRENYLRTEGESAHVCFGIILDEVKT